MRFILSISLLLSYLCFSAQTSKTIDSTLVTELALLTKKKEVFKCIYANTFNESFYKRIDSIEFYNVIIEAKAIDSIFYLSEYYYKNETDTFPSVVFIENENRSSIEVYNLYNKYTLNTKITKIKKQQSLNYLKKYIIYVGSCATFRPKQKKKETLKQTHQIQIYLNKKTSLLICSFQTPARNPTYKIEERGISF